MTDSYRHKGLRKQLVAELERLGISDKRVLEAINKVPRHAFMSSAFLEFAYENRAFSIAAGQTISQPFTVARQSELLRVNPGDKVLEVGTGSGYQAAVLAAMGVKVYSIERHKVLHDGAKLVLQKLNYRVHSVYGDGYKGLPAFAPFMGVIITCAVPRIPELLIDQLEAGGRLVMPFGDGAVQEMIVLTKNSDGSLQEEKHGTFSFVPMLEKRVDVS
ncbi:MAG: protein-L-isoaspartate(D-aspartate) O-methyltransferase [Flavobacteriales bacterium]|nr:protein-L-isoaspartate(D-aspartate) O-methyltransferase [Flavobacteriales bacterium]